MPGETTVVQRPVPAVRAIIVNEHGQVLLLRRAVGSAGGGQWCLPGGKVDYGQTVEEAVRREVEEETALICAEVRFLFYQDSPACEPGSMHCINFYFACRTTGAMTINDESTEARWIGATDLPAIQVAFRNDEALARFFGGGA